MIDSLGSGGAEQTLARVVESLDRDRFEIRVAVLQERDGNPIADVVRSAGIPVDLVEVRRLRSLAGHLRVLRYLRRVRPEVVHTHLEFAHSLGGVYGWFFGAKVIGTVHTFAMGRESLEERRLSIMWWSLRRAHRVVIAPSRAGLDHLQSVGRIAPEKLRVMHNGVDLGHFYPGESLDLRLELGIPVGIPLIATVAVLRPGKGLSALVEAMDRIVSQVPNAMALFVGDGPMRSVLEAKAEESGLGGRIVFTGHREDVARLLRCADLFVLPTHEDLLPTVVAEAMGSGLPVVATRVGGLQEMVDDGVTGRLYPVGDVEALADRCVEMLTDTERARRFGSAGRARAEQLFDLKGQIRDLERLYTEVVI
jgi:glycosyltransferase involved in cell wall biosynthesis